MLTAARAVADAGGSGYPRWKIHLLAHLCRSRVRTNDDGRLNHAVVAVGALGVAMTACAAAALAVEVTVGVAFAAAVVAGFLDPENRSREAEHRATAVRWSRQVGPSTKSACGDLPVLSPVRVRFSTRLGHGG